MLDLGSNYIWLLDTDGVPIDFGEPYGPPTVVQTLLPPQSSTDLELAIAQVDAWRLDILDTDIIRRVHRPDFCPEPFLPILAWEYSVDEWDPEWTASTKREAIKLSYEIHRHKGTAYSVETAINALNFGAKVQEWFEYGGTAYRFRLTIDLNEFETWTGKRADQLIRTAFRTKNVRSRLESIIVRRTTKSAGPYIGAAMRNRIISRLTPELPSLITVQPYLHIGGAIGVRTTIRILPSGAY